MSVTLVEEEPFVHVVDAGLVSRVCTNCMKHLSEDSDRCSGCNFAYYCDYYCQNEDWPNHEAECKLQSQSTAPLSPTIRIVIRTIVKLQRGDDTHPAYNGLLFATIKNDVELVNEALNAFRPIYDFIRQKSEIENVPSFKDLFKIFCKIAVNMMLVKNHYLSPIGYALYLGLSALQHSCNPNAVVVFSGKKAVLRSLNKDVKEYSDELRISRCDTMDIVAVRREMLRMRHYFTCKCELCPDVLKDEQKCSLRCTKCFVGYCPYRPRSGNLEVLCEVCNEKSFVDDKAVKALYQRLLDKKSLKGQLYKMIELYRDCEPLFATHNIILSSLARSILFLAWDQKKLDIAAEYAEKTLETYKIYYPSSHPSISVLMYQYAHLLMEQKNENHISIIKQAYELICDSHGVDSSFASEAAQSLNCAIAETDTLSSQSSH